MNVVHEKCAGIDVGKSSVSVCCLVGPVGTTPRCEVREFATTTQEVLNLADWLGSLGVTDVAMESTGVYWKPLYNLLEGLFTLCLVNAHHAKAVPGRKTDVQDCQWLAELHRHGLLKASFVPPLEIRALRELTRYRRNVIQEKAREGNRVEKLLEDTNIKLSTVATDILGKSGRAMLRAIAGGETKPAVLAELAVGRLRSKQDALRLALQGKVKPHHRFLITELLDHVEYLEKQIERLDAQIEEALRPFQEEVRRLDAVPGLNRRTIEDVIAEIGTDMTQFKSSQHLASWAGLCPTNNESAGKRGRTKLRKGSRWLKSALIQASWCAAASKKSYFRALFLRLKAKRGPKKAIGAVAHSLLETIYNLLQKRVEYRDLGMDYYVRNDREKIKNKLVRRLKDLGYEVSIEEKHPA